MLKAEEVRLVASTIDEAHAVSDLATNTEDFHTGIGMGVSLSIDAYRSDATVDELLDSDKLPEGWQNKADLVLGLFAGSLATHRINGQKMRGA